MVLLFELIFFGWKIFLKKGNVYNILWVKLEMMKVGLYENKSILIIYYCVFCVFCVNW